MKSMLLLQLQHSVVLICDLWLNCLFRFQRSGFALALAMINAIEVMNKSPLLVNANITLGYRILDSCSDVSTALRVTNDLMQQSNCRSSGSSSSCGQPIMAVVGASYSEMTIAVARQLTLRMIPQVRQNQEECWVVLNLVKNKTANS